MAFYQKEIKEQGAVTKKKRKTLKSLYLQVSTRQKVAPPSATYGDVAAKNTGMWEARVLSQLSEETRQFIKDRFDVKLEESEV